ncbi:MAG: DUF3820 family protein [Simkaniaceae bacterium]|nr:DUF3820 family protein [Simkaniaceae bacterium]
MSKRAIYYDTETTGVRPGSDRIVEIAAYDATLKKEYVSLINPGMPIPPESSKIHNITDEMVANSPSMKQVAQELIEFCEGDVVLIAHNNAAFDKPFLEAEFARNDVIIPEWDYIDTLKWARKYRPDLPRHTLQHLREVYGYPENNAHRALDDVITLCRVFNDMIGDLPIETVMKLLIDDGIVRHMPFGKYKGLLLQDVPESYVRWLDENGALDKPDNESLKASFLKCGVLQNASPTSNEKASSS